jgi:hypothetical protein
MFNVNTLYGNIVRYDDTIVKCFVDMMKDVKKKIKVRS